MYAKHMNATKEWKNQSLKKNEYTRKRNAFHYLGTYFAVIPKGAYGISIHTSRTTNTKSSSPLLSYTLLVHDVIHFY